MSMGYDILGVAATGMFLSAVASTGLLGELMTKGGNPKSVIKTVCEVSTKVLQNFSAGSSLVLMGTALAGPPGGFLALATLPFMVATPIVSGVVKHRAQDEKTKEMARKVDQLFNLSAKITNIAVSSLTAALIFGSPAAIGVGVTLTAFSVIALVRE